MKVTVFTSNRPRHLSLLSTLAEVADEVFAVQECSTVLPGQVQDFYNKSPVMQRYFTHVLQAEHDVFGRLGFAPPNVRHMPLRMGDLNLLSMDDLGPALESDVYVVFGASYIKGPLAEFLVERTALNIHMGVSPYYRGSSTNFWALYDGRPDHVGATIHRLTKGLDSGPMLFHAFPPSEPTEPFRLGMLAVRSAHQAVADRLATGELFEIEPVPQDRSLEMRYTRNAEFTDEVAADYLDHRLPTAEQIGRALRARDESAFLRPYIAEPAELAR